mmetsp:Transcript_19412/g.58600  ORF Transcript_19412/g.58600 Transcript_19412/m.58600 type:complete len:80 (+) Transcript_19412:482-721(+)
MEASQARLLYIHLTRQPPPRKSHQPPEVTQARAARAHGEIINCTASFLSARIRRVEDSRGREREANNNFSRIASTLSGT